LIKTAASPKIALSVWKYFRIASGIVSTEGELERAGRAKKKAGQYELPRLL